jgi:hypothetical protein
MWTLHGGFCPLDVFSWRLMADFPGGWRNRRVRRLLWLFRFYNLKVRGGAFSPFVSVVVIVCGRTTWKRLGIREGQA